LSTVAGDEARRVQRDAQPEEGAPTGQSQAEVEREAGLLADNAEKNAWEANGTIDRIILIGVLLTAVLGVLAGFWRASGRPARGLARTRCAGSSRRSRPCSCSTASCRSPARTS
jgi:hypothetical protein